MVVSADVFVFVFVAILLFALVGYVIWRER